MTKRNLSQTIAGLTPEFRLAAAVSWLPPPALADWHISLVKELCSKISDWDKFIVMVDRHRIPVLAYSNLGGFVDIVPFCIMEVMKKRSQAAKLHALRHAAEFSRLARLLEQNGIACIPLKGQVLSQQLYGDPAIRQTKDLDLLVKPQDLEKTGHLLRAEGYLSETDVNLTPSQARFVISTSQHHEFHHPQRGIALELHWRSALWNDKDMLFLWDSSVMMRFGGSEVRTMDREMQLLYLCDHGARHKWFRLKWLGDLARIISGSEISSWSRVVDLAEGMDLQRGLGQCAILIERLYKIPLPTALSHLAHKNTSASLACDALKRLIMSDANINVLARKAEGIKLLFYYKRLRPSLPIMTLLRRQLINSADFRVVRLPDRLLWMYILLRPASWFWRHYLDRWLNGRH